MPTAPYRTDVLATPDCLLHLADVWLAPPVIEIDGRPVTLALADVAEFGTPRRFANGVTETNYEGAVRDQPGLRLRVTLRTAEADPIVRFQFTLTSDRPRTLTKSAGRDNLAYFSVSLASLPRVTEVRVSEFRETVHSFCLREEPVSPGAFENHLAVMGPMLVASDGSRSMLLAYEHGSQVPDAFLKFHLAPDRTVRLSAVKGNYYRGRVIGPDQAFDTIWFQFGQVAGDEQALAKAYRRFVLEHMSPNTGSRKPYVYYNTWNYQERNRWWNGQPYLESMREDRILAEIDVAHRMGIDVFVIDTGWFEKTGDWRVNRKRFPDGMKAVKDRLDRYGMKLGLWFDNAAAASSDIVAKHPDCVTRDRSKEPTPHPIWETPESFRMCLPSPYWEAFADELIRLVKEVGVTYFKWDAIGQYGCRMPGHNHGEEHNSDDEIRESYGFELGRAMIRIVDKLCAACPESIVDFDITEGGRFVGLGFLAAGKYFLINNGPYYQNYDLPVPPPGNTNIFFFPGVARTWICREPLGFDKWIPSILFLTHYLPDDPAENQLLAIASLVLGQNGIWGDLLNISDDGINRFAKLLALYKQVRDDVTRADPIRAGVVGGSPEVHEKIDPTTGRGVICVFATAAGEYEYVSHNKVDPRAFITDGASVQIDPAGRAKLSLAFDKPTAHIAYFGVTA